MGDINSQLKELEVLPEKSIFQYLQEIHQVASDNKAKFKRVHANRPQIEQIMTEYSLELPIDDSNFPEIDLFLAKVMDV